MAKRHHYVPITYLRHFTDADGRLHVYRKDDPQRPLRLRPEKAAFERYYYSQVAEDGTRDDEHLEAIFSEVETHWPSIVKGLSNREPTFKSAPEIITFLALTRVRVPAFRDAAEAHAERSVHAQLELMQAAGRLPAMPAGYENLLDNIEVSIDPHRSLIQMAEIMNDIGRLFASLSFDVLHNETDMPFLTSDNPVMYFDPSAPASRMLPYTIRPPTGPVELLFPVTPKMMLRGRSSPQRPQIGHRTMRDRQWVKRVNRLVTRFAYKAVFASRSGSETLIVQNAGISPVPKFDRAPAPEGGHFAFSQMVFGPRSIKPKY